MLKITEASQIGPYQLRLLFSDGSAGVVDLESCIGNGVFAPLTDAAYFAKFELTDHTVQWPNGADFAPEYLHGLISPLADIETATP